MLWVVALWCVALLCVVSGCASSQKEDTVRPEQTYASSMNYLVEASPEQTAKLNPIWMTRQREEERLKNLYPAGEQLTSELEKLDKKTVDEARPVLSAEQSASLENVFLKQRDYERESDARSRKTADKLAEEDRNRPPPKPKPTKESGPPQGSGGPM